MELLIEHGYSDCYPKEQSNDENCFKVKFETMEKLSEYVNKIYLETIEYCDGPPCLNMQGNIQGYVLHTYAFIPKSKQATKEDIIKLLRDENDYDNIPKRDIEMYSISLWFNPKR
jgi:hypothetical protein